MKSIFKQKQIAAFFILGVLTLIWVPAWGQENRTQFEVSGFIDWAPGEVNIEASFNLAQAGIRLPTGRFMGEEILREAHPRLLRPYLFSLVLDSNSTIRDLVNRGEVSLEELDTLSQGSGKNPPSLSADLTRMIGRYTVNIEKISAFLTRNRRAVEAPVPLIPAGAADYTGIIIIADEELPVRGRKTNVLAGPCLFPKIWDTNMNLVYDINMFENSRKEGALMVRYTVPENIFRPTPSGLEGELAALTGPYPLRILAREVFGINQTDLIITRDDALKILSTGNNRRLLREGRVVLALNEKMLKTQSE